MCLSLKSSTPPILGKKAGELKGKYASQANEQGPRNSRARVRMEETSNQQISQSASIFGLNMCLKCPPEKRTEHDGFSKSSYWANVEMAVLDESAPTEGRAKCSWF
jgi:hypothetical protein